MPASGLASKVIKLRRQQAPNNRLWELTTNKNQIMFVRSLQKRSATRNAQFIFRNMHKQIKIRNKIIHNSETHNRAHNGQRGSVPERDTERRLLQGCTTDRPTLQPKQKTEIVAGSTVWCSRSKSEGWRSLDCEKMACQTIFYERGFWIFVIAAVKEWLIIGNKAREESQGNMHNCNGQLYGAGWNAWLLPE